MNWLSQILGFFKSFQFWIVIAPWESGLRVRLGKSAVVLGPGPHFRMPFIDRLFIQSVRLRTISDSGQTMVTRDGKVVSLSVAVSYEIADIEKLYRSVCNPEATLLHQVQGLVADFIAKSDSEALRPATIEESVSKSMPSTEWGLGKVKLMVTTFAYARVIRLMTYEYRNLTGTNEMSQHA